MHDASPIWETLASWEVRPDDTFKTRHATRLGDQGRVIWVGSTVPVGRFAHRAIKTTFSGFLELGREKGCANSSENSVRVTFPRLRDSSRDERVTA